MPVAKAAWQEAPALIEQDSLALVAFFEEAEGNSWYRKRNWLSGPLNTWFGVTVAEGRVTKLELPDNRIPGLLSESIGQLTGLRELDLSSNFFYGEIPGSINGLLDLEVLNLSNNAFRSLPEALGALQKLRVLDVRSNGVHEDLPADIRTLSSLEILDLSHNQLSKLPDLSTLRDFGVLQRMDVSHNGLGFGDIERHLWVAPEFLYNQQRLRGTTLTGLEGDAVVLQGAFGGQYNQYQWYRGETRLAGQTSDRFVIQDYQQSDADTYILEVTNRRATRLTLQHVFEVEFDSKRRLKWLDIGDYQHVYN